MNERRQRTEAAFHAAQECATPEELGQYLSALSEQDPELGREVEDLLQAAAGADAVFPATDTTAWEGRVEDRPGITIGRYRLLEQIGEGGMGVVYRADQQEPVRRQVALKIIKLGMDTRQVVARFEAERQALALMDHPSIAKVLDGGMTGGNRSEVRMAGSEGIPPFVSPASEPPIGNPQSEFRPGRPYFVMELVEGVPITEFCEKNGLSIEQRLRLFIQVAQAVQHAHQKGIIHRDIKPSNVLVTLPDGPPVPKIIDFGVAKAINQRLTEKTFFTQDSILIGTPAYMSPEQAATIGLDVDTRSDIYSLGVLLYELLTGSQPIPEQRLRSVSFSEMQRIILHEQPERPSLRLRKLAAAAAHGPPNPNQKPRIPDHRSLASDLDWIVLKCLEKDRNRRYETANGLAADLQRHLADEPVIARPPSPAYRFQKLVRRNKAQCLAAAAMTLVLIAASVVSTRQALRAMRAQEIASAEAEKSRRAEELARAEAIRARNAEVRSAEHAESAKAIKAFLLENLLGVDCCGESVEPDAASFEATQALLYRVARRLEDRFADQPRIEAEIRQALVRGFFSARDHHSVVAQAGRLVELDQRLFGPYDTNTLKAVMDLGYATYQIGRREEGMRLLAETIGAVGALDSPERNPMLDPLEGTYGLLLLGEGRTEEALPRLRQAVAGARRIDPSSTASRAWGSQLAGALEQAGNWPESERLWRELLESSLRELGPTHPQTLDKQFGLGRVLVRQRRAEEALPVLSSVITSFQMRLGATNFSTLRARAWQALALDQKGDAAAVTALYQDLHPLFQSYISYVGARYTFEEMADFFVRERNYAAARGAFESLLTHFDARPPANAEEFKTYIRAIAATKGWPAVADLYRANFDRFPGSLDQWLHKAWVFRYLGNEESLGLVVERALALASSSASTNDQHVPIEIAALDSRPIPTEREKQLEALIKALEAALPGRSDHQTAWGYRAIGHLRIRLGRFDQALNALSASARHQSPADAFTLLLKAVCLHRLGRPAEARAAFDSAEALVDPDLRRRPVPFEGFRPLWQIYQHLLFYREARTLLGLEATVR